jgi:hypothetical protein
MANPSPFNTGIFVWNSSASRGTFKVSFPKTPNFKLFLIGAEVYKDVNHHDRLVLHFKGKPTLKQDVLLNGDPVSFTYGSGKDVSTFNGHVHYVDQANTLKTGNTDVYCTAASYILKETGQNIYTDLTADQVVSKIATRFKFAATTQKHPRVRKAVVQGGQTYWQLMTSLAKQTGFALIADNTNITFVSKDKIFNTKKKNAPYFFYVDGPDTGMQVPMTRMYGTIVEFHPNISDKSPERGVVVDRTINGIDPKTGNQIHVTHPYKNKPGTNSGSVVPNQGYFLGQ